jgi:GT2 family glycosyltransferase
MTIAVAITTYNQARFIETTLASVLAQTRSPDEIIVVDDGSTDATPSILQRYTPRVRVIRQANGGVARARNRAVQEATSDLVALLDGDDLWMPDKIEACLSAAAAAGGGRVIVHDIETISADASATLQRHPMRESLRQSTGTDQEGVLDAWAPLVKGNFVWTTSQVVIDRRLYEEVGASDPRFPVASDYDLYLRLAARTPFVIVPKVLARWRQHDASASGVHQERWLNWAVEIARVLQARAAVADGPRAATLRSASAAAVSNLVTQVYRREEQWGTWRTARNLFRVAVECRSPRSAALGVALFVPSAWRRAAAALTGIRVS